MKSVFLHLRFPFSWFLLPVFLFALAISPNLNGERVQWVFIIVHFLLYPASNGFNSYFDRDEKSIGGLKTPPPVNKGLYWTATLMDLTSLVAGYLLLSPLFSLALLGYIAVSRAYSHPAVRLKKLPWTGWLITGLFQGAYTFGMCYIGINQFDVGNLLVPHVAIPALLTTLLLWANYPMTQVYQHEEDGRRGDITLSLRLGIKGTFYFTAILFAFASIAYCLYFVQFYTSFYAWWFVAAMGLPVVYFLFWMRSVHLDIGKADYRHAMQLNLISSTCLNVFFVWFFLDSTQVGQFLF